MLKGAFLRKLELKITMKMHRKADMKNRDLANMPNSPEILLHAIDAAAGGATNKK